ncbi:MAG: dihydroneopterin aldolase family protein [Methanobacteriaceae archaeon]|jgi:hypothetical protein|nr:dihydroneopterin aldolase family protein [Methanobacteriaceae archaeon]
MNVDKEFFSNITSRERAIFEGGISMGALFHQFIGTPVNEKTKENLEKTIENSLKLQPAVENVDVTIDSEKLKEISEFEYISLNGDMLNVLIQTKINDISVDIRLEFIKELNYPLMYVEEIRTIRKD